MATVGQTLTAPEAGWKRYDDTHPTIRYTANNRTYLGSNSSGSYNSTTSSIYDIGDKISFNFTGSQIRLVVLTNSTRSRNTIVKINGITEATLDCYSDGSNMYQVLIFEKTNLSNGIHSVEIIKNDASLGFTLDAIDIDSTGSLLHPDEVQSVEELAVGKRIRCHYQATSGVVGNFSSLGEEVYVDGINDFIPPASSAAPKGSFYYICVDKDYRGRPVLVADRNVQHSISWDTLNSAKIASGGGLPLNIPIRKEEVAYTDIPVSSSAPFIKVWDTPLAMKGFEIVRTTNVSDQAINEIEVYDENGINIAKQATFNFVNVPASTTIFTSEYVKNGLTDGNKVDYKWDDHPAVAGENGVSLTFNKEMKISKIIVYGHDNYPVKTLRISRLIFNDFFSSNVRLLTGGISSTDLDNEWTQYIVNGTGGGAYPAGDNGTWNWSGLLSWSSSTASGSSGNRTYRGNASVGGFGSNSTSTSATTVGFRPVLVVESLFTEVQKHLIFHEGQYKKWDGAAFVSVSANPTEEEFLSVGMDSLNTIPAAALNALGEFEVATYRNHNQAPRTSFQVPGSIYRSASKDYAGQGKIVTDVEILPAGRKLIFIEAEHENCLFDYSLDGGKTWYTCNVREVIDITTKEGHELMIRVSLPDAQASIKALSYAWA